MNKWYLIALLLICVCLSCKMDKADAELSNKILNKQTVAEIETLDFNQFQNYLTKTDDKLYVINFWATWCKPCVEELPYFETINEAYSSDEVEVLLVSLDMPSMLKSHVLPFVKKRGIKSNVILLDDPNSNFWIPKIDKEWSGAIPATLFYKDDERKFFEKTFTYNELQTTINSFL